MECPINAFGLTDIDVLSVFDVRKSRIPADIGSVGGHSVMSDIQLGRWRAIRWFDPDGGYSPTGGSNHRICPHASNRRRIEHPERNNLLLHRGAKVGNDRLLGHRKPPCSTSEPYRIMPEERKVFQTFHNVASSVQTTFYPFDRRQNIFELGCLAEDHGSWIFIIASQSFEHVSNRSKRKCTRRCRGKVKIRPIEKYLCVPDTIRSESMIGNCVLAYIASEEQM